MKKHQVPLCALVCVLLSIPASAQDMWSQIQDHQVSSFEGRYLMTRHNFPEANYDINKFLALAEEQGKNLGETPAQIEARKQMVRDANPDIVKGTTQKSSVTLTRIGDVYKADIIQSRPVVTGEDAGAQVAHFVNYYDGKNKVIVEGMGQQTPRQASLERDEGLELPHLVSDFPAMVLLSMAPPSQFFSAKSALQKANNALVLEQPFNQPVSGGIHRGIWRLTLDSDTLNPMKLEVLNARNRAVGQIYTVEAYKTVDGIQVPAKITTSVGNSFEVTWQLQEARLNNSVDKANLLLAAGTEINDYRFGAEKALRYKIVDGKLLSDTQVRKLLGEQKAVAAAEDARITESGMPVIVLAGLSFLGLGGVLWKKGSFEK